MAAIVEIVLGIFGLIGVGYVAARSGLLGPAVADGLTDFVFTIAIPLLLFRTLVTADLEGVSPWGLWIPYFAVVAVIWAGGHFLVRRIFGRDARAGMVAGVSASYSNLALIGLPLIQSVFGDAGIVFLVILVAVNLPVMMLASTVMNEVAMRADGVTTGAVDKAGLARHFLLTLVTHPILIGIAAGILWRVLDLPLGGPPGAVVEKLAEVAGPLALFVSGMALQSYGVARQIKPAIVISMLKLLLMPLLVYGLARAVGLPELAVQVVTLSAACPTGVNAFLVASRLGTGQALASNSLLISTAAALVTVALWLAVLQALAG